MLNSVPGYLLTLSMWCLRCYETGTAALLAVCALGIWYTIHSMLSLLKPRVAYGDFLMTRSTSVPDTPGATEDAKKHS